jgi:hypothetical protein
MLLCKSADARAATPQPEIRRDSVIARAHLVEDNKRSNLEWRTRYYEVDRTESAAFA